MYFEQFRNQTTRHASAHLTSTQEIKEGIVRAVTKKAIREMNCSRNKDKKKTGTRYSSVIERLENKACPVGYKFNKKTLRCEPRRPQDSVSGNGGGGRNSSPANGPGYNVIGATGLNGDGYAYADTSDSGGDMGGDAGGGISEGCGCEKKAKKKCEICGKTKCGCPTFSNMSRAMELNASGQQVEHRISYSNFAEEEKKRKDACYHKVKSRYDIFPSAYASGALVQCRKQGAKRWGNSTNK